MRISKYLKFVIFIFIGSTTFLPKSCAQTNKIEQHIMVSMRMIGHELLLRSGDSISRVLPIEKIEDRYRIEFDTRFSFTPDDLAKTIDQFMKHTNISSNYIVEIEQCASKEVVYSYEKRQTPELGMMPCKQRSQLRDCYKIFITLLDSNMEDASLFSFLLPLDANPGNRGILLNVLIFCLFMGLIILLFTVYRKRRTQISPVNDDMIHLGNYRFDKRNRALSYKDQKTDLTSKESDLLLLLYSSANTIISRENILNRVWGDEGDYVGRTLDVFISKLRKKLDSDSNIKIINIRGVGYKFVINAQ